MKAIDYKIIEKGNAVEIQQEVLALSKQGYVLNGPLVTQGEAQYTMFVQGMVKYETEEAEEKVVQIHFVLNQFNNYIVLGLTNTGRVVQYNQDKDKWVMYCRSLEVQGNE